MFDVKHDKEKVKRKRKKKDDDDKTKPARRCSTSSSTSNDIPKKRQRRTKPKQVISVDEDEDEEEVCASKSCARPSGEEVDWVQCDSCELWFHVVCIGLTSEKAEALDSFKCNLCIAPVVNISSTKGSDSPESVNVDVDSTTPCANSPCAASPTDSSQGCSAYHQIHVDTCTVHL